MLANLEQLWFFSILTKLTIIILHISSSWVNWSYPAKFQLPIQAPSVLIWSVQKIVYSYTIIIIISYNYRTRCPETVYTYSFRSWTMWHHSLLISKIFVWFFLLKYTNWHFIGSKMCSLIFNKDGTFISVISFSFLVYVAYFFLLLIMQYLKSELPQFLFGNNKYKSQCSMFSREINITIIFNMIPYPVRTHNLSIMP